MRRSLRSKLLIPLDLHVLGLPLAFILSQDQTLHRIFFIFLRSVSQVFFSIKSSFSYSLLCCQFNMSMNVSSCFLSLYSGALRRCLLKRVQKYNFFFNWQAFLKKKLFFFAALFLSVFQFCNDRHSSRFGWAKILSFSFILQVFFCFFLRAAFLFFKLFLIVRA